MILGYWKIRGMKTPINYCLEYCDEKYSEELHELKPDSDGNYNFTSSYKESNKTKILYQVPWRSYPLGKKRWVC